MKELLPTNPILMVMVLYICVGFGMLAHLPLDLSQAAMQMAVATRWENAQNDNYFAKIVKVFILSVAHLESQVTFFSAWDKSRAKWANSQKPTKRTYIKGKIARQIKPMKLSLLKLKRPKYSWKTCNYWQRSFFLSLKKEVEVYKLD